jgi:hypothetical protein
MPQHVTALERPSKDAIRTLAPFPGLPLSRIHLPRSPEEFAFARREIFGARVVGLDTETKPKFVKGEVSDGPHVVQIATARDVFIFLLDHHGGKNLVRQVLKAEHLIKVGFGLVSDLRLLHRKLGTTARQTLELSEVVQSLGYSRPVGLQMSVAIVLERYLAKPLKGTRSNWACERLTTKQLRYAANDAYAALCIYTALGLGDCHPRTRAVVPVPPLQESLRGISQNSSPVRRESRPKRSSSSATATKTSRGSAKPEAVSKSSRAFSRSTRSTTTITP